MFESGDGKSQRGESFKKVTAFRRFLPQVIAATIKNIHAINLGTSLAIPTIIIPALIGISNEHNQNEPLTTNGSEASWVGSIQYVPQVVGCLLSGLLTDRFGRKRSMIVVNLPFAIGWLFLCQATQIWHIYIGLALLGLACGLLEASVILYLGEICEPSIRGTIVAYANMCMTIGFCIVYTLNQWFSWRTVAVFCFVAPISSAISLCFIPETPHWLLSKNRPNDAKKSLRWLRGWVCEEAIVNEFYNLKRHSERSKSCDSCVKQDLHCSHPPPSLNEKFGELKKKRTLKPFTIIISLFTLSQFTGLWAMRPYIVQIFDAYDSPFSSDQNVMILGFVDNFANIIFTCMLRFTGKRRIYFAMNWCILISSLVVCWYGFIFLPSGFNSFDQKNRAFDLENPNLAYIPTICLYVWNFCSMCGYVTMGWVLLSEIFSLKSRGLASGICAALYNVLAFTSKKTYYNLETTLSLPGISLFFCLISALGLILMYFILPETEDRTLEDIELHFSDNSKTLCDRNIAKSTEQNRHEFTELLSKPTKNQNYTQLSGFV